jgi:hypothetical protein
MGICYKNNNLMTLCIKCSGWYLIDDLPLKPKIIPSLSQPTALWFIMGILPISLLGKNFSYV